MKIFKWTDMLSLLETGREEAFFTQGTGISIGSFDGLHKGHRVLLNELTAGCKKMNLKAGVVTFMRPLPSIKHSVDYLGDISTFEQRLSLFEQLGIDFVISVDFDDSFASMLGVDFLNLLVNLCNMKFIAEGIDFRCGYKGATDVQAIRYFAEKNGIRTAFVDPVYFMPGTDEEERISSSYIRSMVLKGFFSTVKELLERPYELDIKSVKQSGAFTQALPPDGIYRTLTEKNELFRLEIKDGKIKTLPDCDLLKFE